MSQILGASIASGFAASSVIPLPRDDRAGMSIHMGPAANGSVYNFQVQGAFGVGRDATSGAVFLTLARSTGSAFGTFAGPTPAAGGAIVALTPDLLQQVDAIRLLATSAMLVTHSFGVLIKGV